MTAKLTSLALLIVSHSIIAHSQTVFSGSGLSLIEGFNVRTEDLTHDPTQKTGPFLRKLNREKTCYVGVSEIDGTYEMTIADGLQSTQPRFVKVVHFRREGSDFRLVRFAGVRPAQADQIHFSVNRATTGEQTLLINWNGGFFHDRAHLELKTSSTGTILYARGEWDNIGTHIAEILVNSLIGRHKNSSECSFDE